VELAEIEHGWLWRNGITGSMPGVGFGCYDRLGAKNAKGTMENIVSGEEPIAWCD
jgi:hypothetical protein